MPLLESRVKIQDWNLFLRVIPTDHFGYLTFYLTCSLLYFGHILWYSSWHILFWPSSWHVIVHISGFLSGICSDSLSEMSFHINPDIICITYVFLHSILRCFLHSDILFGIRSDINDIWSGIYWQLISHYYTYTYIYILYTYTYILYFDTAIPSPNGERHLPLPRSTPQLLLHRLQSTSL